METKLDLSAKPKQPALDYSKWESLAKQDDDEEKRQKQAERDRNRERYYKDQAERQKKFLEDKKEKEAKEKVAQSSNHNHHHDHSNCSHDHDHHQHDANTSKPDSKEEEDPTLGMGCGCGYVDPERLKKIAEHRAKNPPLPLPELNKKKMMAVEATREDGNRLFKEGNFENAFKVYERGVLILNGMHGLSEEQQNRVNELEIILDLNMAACRLKQKRWLEALENCKIVLGLDKTNSKAWYRKAEAYMGMGEYEKAISEYKAGLAVINPKDAVSFHKQITECQRLLQEQNAKAKAFERQMAEKIKAAQKQKSSTSEPEDVKSGK